MAAITNYGFTFFIPQTNIELVQISTGKLIDTMYGVFSIFSGKRIWKSESDLICLPVLAIPYNPVEDILICLYDCEVSDEIKSKLLFNRLEQLFDNDKRRIEICSDLMEDLLYDTTIPNSNYEAQVNMGMEFLKAPVEQRHLIFDLRESIQVGLRNLSPTVSQMLGL